MFVFVLILVSAIADSIIEDYYGISMLYPNFAFSLVMMLYLANNGNSWLRQRVESMGHAYVATVKAESRIGACAVHKNRDIVAIESA